MYILEWELLFLVPENVIFVESIVPLKFTIGYVNMYQKKGSCSPFPITGQRTQKYFVIYWILF